MKKPPSSVDFLAQVINAVADPLFVKDREFRMLLVNDALCALLDRPRAQILGRTDYDFMPKEQADVFRREDQRVLETGRESVNEELVSDAQGVAHLVVTKKTRSRDDKGNPILVGVIRDITELARANEDVKRAHERLQRSQKLEAVGRLAGGVAHDFNNILTAIVGSASLLLESLPPGHPGREEVEEIRQASRRASALTRQLLAFSRREAGLARVVDLRELFGDMRRMLQRLLPADIELDLRVPARLGGVRVDPGQAEQVLLNLVVNAGDAMRDGGRIVVELADEDAGGYGLDRPGVRLTVRDTGVGMDAPTRERIFEPFYTTKEKGHGLGLATVGEIVRQAGGAISVESEPGRGAAFHVLWPRCDEPVDSDSAEGAAALKSPRRCARVLVVEDDDAVRRFAVRSLERFGYQVATAADGLEGVRVSDAHEGLFDLLLVDIVLPRLRGPEMVKRLRARQPTAKVLYMSGYRQEEGLLPHGPGAPALFLPKPFTAQELAERVRLLIEA